MLLLWVRVLRVDGGVIFTSMRSTCGCDSRRVILVLFTLKVRRRGGLLRVSVFVRLLFVCRRVILNRLLRTS